MRRAFVLRGKQFGHLDGWASRPPHVSRSPRNGDAVNTESHPDYEALSHTWPDTLRHILDDTVDAELSRRVRVGLHLEPDLFWTNGAAPALAMRQEKLLVRRGVVLLCGQVDCLPLCVFEEGYPAARCHPSIGAAGARRALRGASTAPATLPCHGDRFRSDSSSWSRDRK